jgi:hypothetical protein
LATVTVTGAETTMFPALSLATAVNVCAPFVERVVSHLIPYGAEVSRALRFAPSSLNCTLAIPALAVAVAETCTVLPDTTAPGTGAVMETDPGLEASVVKVESPEVARFPAPSRDLTR